MAAILGAAAVFGGSCPPCLVVVEYVPYYRYGANRSAPAPPPAGANASAGHGVGISPLPMLQSYGYRCGRRDASRHHRCVHKTAPRCNRGGI